ncbi:hypothetical protein FXO38_27295 [Capsicum annuum]|nr:hypothetical protein FXO37_31981 [Capsicum annuum]KAF3630200.1 hypothetical protein FXO38_27295 [Capsicum annuum]
MLEIEQPNQEEIHVFVKGHILKFSIYEFSLITGLNCFDNVDDFKYEDSSPSWLMKRYFPQSTNGINKEALVELFLKENFENKEDVLQMAIIYFIHTFIYSHLNASTVPFSDFKMVEDKKYQFFSWGKVSFSRLMASLRQEFSMEKQLYRLGSIPQVLNVWMFELCSNVDTKVVVREGNNTPRILNWRIVAVRTQFNQFRIRMFSKIDQKFKDLERVMNDRFTKVLKSLQQKNETVKQETILKQSRQECDPLDDVVDDTRPTSIDSVVKVTDKSIEIEGDKANQTLSFLKNGEQHEKITNIHYDVGIEKKSDIVVEEMQPLESIIPGREHDLTLTIYKPPPTTPTEYTTTDCFFKMYIDKTYVNYCNSDVAKDLATQDASARTDEIIDMEISLINTIKGLSTCAGQPWHMVNEIFVPINCDGVFYWVLTDIALNNR